MIILNLGCGTKTSSNPAVVNIDWSVSLKITQSPFLKLFSGILLNGARSERVSKAQGKIVVHDLSKGIPYPDKSVEAVYHSHMMEHINRNDVNAFLRENYRVLKPGGILRVVVPDFEALCREYIGALDAGQDVSPAEHETYIENIIEQSVRVEAYGTSQQRQPRRFIENMILGDARKRGETHQWMYDKRTLPAALERAGFKDVKVKEFDSSDIPGWNEIGLDLNDDKGQYKPASLYVEGQR